MTHLLLRANRRNNNNRIHTELCVSHHLVARWMRDADGTLRCVWSA